MAEFEYLDPATPIRTFMRKVTLEKWTRMLTDNDIPLIQCHDGVWRPILTEYKDPGWHADTPTWRQGAFKWAREHEPIVSSAFLKNDQA